MNKKRLRSLFLLSFLLLIILGCSYLRLSQTIYYQVKAVSKQTKITLQKKPVLFVNLFVDRTKKSITVKSIEKATGSVPDYSSQGLDFLSVEIVNSAKQKNLLSIPLTVYEESNNSIKKLDTFSQTIILPYDESSQIKISKNFGDNQIVTSTVNLTAPKSATFLTNTPTPILAQNYQLETIFDGDPTLTDPTKTLDIVMVSSGFNQAESSRFRSFVSDQADWMIGFLNHPGESPFVENKRLIKVRSLVSTDIFHQMVGGQPTIDHDRIMKMLSESGVPFDQYLVVLNADGISGASLGGTYAYLFLTRYGSTQQGLLMAHEFAHSFGAILDEYVNSDSVSAELPAMNRNCKEDPTESWVHNERGGSYIGCGYGANLYRPEPYSIMNNLDYNQEFNNPTKYLLKQALAAYTENKIVLTAWPSYYRFYMDINDASGIWPEKVAIRSLGNKTSSYHAYFTPTVPWITPVSNMDGTVPGLISFNINSQLLKTKGLYTATLIIEASGVTEQVKIPILIASGNRKETNTLVLIKPSKNLSLNLGDSISVVAQQSDSVPGFSRIEYRVLDSVSNTHIFSSRTISPYNTTFSTIRDDGSSLPLGTYTIFAKGVGYEQGRDVISNSVDVEVTAKPGTMCINTIANYFCTNSQLSRKCYKGSSDCLSQNATFCCPVEVATPTSTTAPTRTPTPKPTQKPIPTNTPIPSATPTPSLSACQQIVKKIQSAYWTRCKQDNYQLSADLNKDQVVNGADFSLLSLVMSKPNSEKYCSEFLSNSTNVCLWASSCSILYGKIYLSMSTSCSSLTSDFHKYDAIADINKDGKVDTTDYNLFYNLANKTIDSTCQSYLSNTYYPCK